MMKLYHWFKVCSISLIVLTLLSYLFSMWMMPAVTIKNNSESNILSSSLVLPNSTLTFDTIAPNQQMTIYYSLRQKPSKYQYQFEFDNQQITGSCLALDDFEIHKRVSLIIDKNNHVICYFAL